MAKNVIHLFGAAGSGTSALGRYIAAKAGFFFMDTDDFYWAPTDPPFRQKRTREERLALINGLLQEHENVVISGSLTDWGDTLIPQFTLAIRVITDTATRIDRIRKREKKMFGSRIEPGHDMHESHIDFVNWAAAYDYGGRHIRSKLRHDEWQVKLDCPLIFVDGAAPFEYNYKKVKRYLKIF